MTPISDSSNNKLAISFDDILAAQENIKDGIVATPQEHATVLSKAIGVDTYLKFEIFQHTASFKDRGALNFLLNLDENAKAKGVVANSAGNHAQGVAYHAERLNIPATIVMPKGTPFNKVKRTEELGAKVILKGDNLSDAGDEANRLMAEQSLTYVPPFDHPLIMAGQGTLALEFLGRFPELDCLVVPIGGGGLISGIAVAAKTINPDIQIIGVQSEMYPAMKEALKGNVIEPANHTIAEGIAVKQPGKLTLEVVRQLVDDILIVSEEEIENAINMLMEVEKVVVEGAGAASLAAVLQFSDFFKGKKCGLVLAGANIDPRILASSLMRGLVHDGRISRLRVTTLDLPGALAKLTKLVAEAGGNIMEVNHQRQFAAIPLKYTEIELVVETKDADHRDMVISSLTGAGFEVEAKTPPTTT
ncbi:MAG: threonine ammonia-lyase [Sphingomonadales bacterium]|nr:threonine ammonia-lyase [Sphingomonadales bacterium]